MTVLAPVYPGLPNVSGANTDTQLIDLWLRGKRSEHTKRAYKTDLLRFGAFLETLPLEADEDLPARPEGLRGTTAQHVQLFVEHLQAEDAAPASVRRRLSALKSLLSYAQKTGYLQYNVGAVIQAPEAHHRVTDRILSKEQIQAILSNAAGRDRALLHYMYYSGVRISEAIKLRVRDLYRPDAEHLTVTVVGKGNKQRIVPLPVEKLWPVLGPFVEGLPPGAWVFPGRKGQHLSQGRAYRIVKMAARLARCPDASPHCLRHSHASHAIRNGAPVHVIQQTLGHASVATTSVYLHVEQGESSGMYL